MTRLFRVGERFVTAGVAVSAARREADGRLRAMAGARDPAAEARRRTSDVDAFDPVMVGGLIRDARVAAGLSMGNLARQSGVSQPFISQLERGQFSPSLATLYRVAAVLDVSPSALLPDGNADGRKVARAGRGARLAMSDDRHSPVARMLSQGSSDVLEAFEYDIEPAPEPTDWFAHSGEELIYVLSGVLALEVEGQEAITLRRGDSIHFDATAPHRWIVTGRRSARIVLVVARGGKH
jgi:transcriptional regulator with XRE-family HTH domain